MYKKNRIKELVEEGGRYVWNYATAEERPGIATDGWRPDVDGGNK